MKLLYAPERRFSCTQRIDRPIGEVFQFFSSEENLERITPPWLNFRVLGKSTPRIQAGTLIDYQLRLSGIPLRWQSRIEVWEPESRFVDVQVRGPYKKWHHTHLFTRDGSGTQMTDTVLYQLPLFRGGDLIAGWKVRRQIEDIFAFRRETIERLFST